MHRQSTWHRPLHRPAQPRSARCDRGIVHHEMLCSTRMRARARARRMRARSTCPDQTLDAVRCANAKEVSVCNACKRGTLCASSRCSSQFEPSCEPSVHSKTLGATWVPGQSSSTSSFSPTVVRQSSITLGCRDVLAICRVKHASYMEPFTGRWAPCEASLENAGRADEQAQSCQWHRLGVAPT